MADRVVNLARARERLRPKPPSTEPEPRTLRPLSIRDLYAEGTLVMMVVPHTLGQAEVAFTAEQARVWGERFLMLADSAEAARRG